MTPSLLVACLCAEWCGSCREYRGVFEEIGKKFPQHRFLWIDIEDQADLMGDIDIENFPSLAIADAGTPLFFGTVLPHGGHLVRLVETLADAERESAGIASPEAEGLIARIVEAAARK